MSDTTFLSLLTHTVSVKRRNLNISSIDYYGIPTETISTSSSSVSCLIQPLRELLEFDIRGKKELATKIGFFKTSDNLLVDDLIVFKSREYVVVGVEDAAGQAHHQEIFLKAVEN